MQLDSLLYQLFSLSFFLSPSLLSFISRCATQWQFARTRDLDSARSLAFWYAIVVLVNAGSLWSHSFEGATQGRTVIIDFVGMARTPSKFQLLFLDFTIIFMQLLLTTIAYDTSLTMAMPEETSDPLAPESYTSSTELNREFTSQPSTSSSFPPSSTSNSTPLHRRPNARSKAPIISTPTSESAALEPVIDLRFQHIIHRLFGPTPRPPDNFSLDRATELLSLPMPATTRGRVTRAFRIIEELQSHRNALEAEFSRRRRERRSAGNNNNNNNRSTAAAGTSEAPAVVDPGGRVDTGGAPTGESQPRTGTSTSSSRIPGAMDDLD